MYQNLETIYYIVHCLCTAVCVCDSVYDSVNAPSNVRQPVHSVQSEYVCLYVSVCALKLIVFSYNKAKQQQQQQQ